jgi:hypothetical protein
MENEVKKITQTRKEGSSMQTQKRVQFMLTIPKADKDVLIKLAAQKNLQNPDARATAAGIGREIVCSYLDSLRDSHQNNKHEEGGQIDEE